jgi:hypothetical protein
MPPARTRRIHSRPAPGYGWSELAPEPDPLLLGLLLRPLLLGPLPPLDRRSGAAAGCSGAGASLLVDRSGAGRRSGVDRTSGSGAGLLPLGDRSLLGNRSPLGDRSTEDAAASGLAVLSGCDRSSGLAPSGGVARSPGLVERSGDGLADGDALGEGLTGRFTVVVGWLRMAAALSSWGWLRICCNTRSGMLGSAGSSSWSAVLETGQPSRGGKDCSPPNQLAIGGGVTRIPKILTSPERIRATEPAPRVEAKVAVTKNNGAIQRLRWG